MITDDGRAALADHQRQWADRHSRPRRRLAGAGPAPDGGPGGLSAWRASRHRSPSGAPIVASAPAVNGHDVAELEDHLRDQIAELSAAGLADDEAFLVAVKRMGDARRLSREFAREHSGRLWKQLVSSRTRRRRASARAGSTRSSSRSAAAVAIQVARLSAGFPDEEPTWLARNLGLFVLPFLAGYFARRRQLDAARLARDRGAVRGRGGRDQPLSRTTRDSDTEILVALHLPVVLWFVGGVAVHGRRRSVARAAHGLRPFHGRVVHLLRAHRARRRRADGVDGWILQPTGSTSTGSPSGCMPSGAAGAVVVAAWLVESKQRVVENMAPVLSMLFTPMFALMLACAAVVYAVTGLGDAFDRELLERLRRTAARRPRARPLRAVRARAVHLSELDGRRPAGRRRLRPRARSSRARIDDRPDRRPRLHAEPNGGARPQPRAPREPGGRRLAVRSYSCDDGARSIGSSGGRRPTSPSSPLWAAVGRGRAAAAVRLQLIDL